MEKYEERNKGAISKNKRKAKPSHPDYTGDLNIDGVEYWISGWIQDGKNGKFDLASLYGEALSSLPTLEDKT